MATGVGPGSGGEVEEGKEAAAGGAKEGVRGEVVNGL